MFNAIKSTSYTRDRNKPLELNHRALAAGGVEKVLVRVTLAPPEVCSTFHHDFQSCLGGLRCCRFVCVELKTCLYRQDKLQYTANADAILP